MECWENFNLLSAYMLLDQCATGSKILTEPEPGRIEIILAGTGPDYKPKKVNRIRPEWPDFLNLNTQLTSHKHKFGNFNFEKWVTGEGQEMSRNF